MGTSNNIQDQVVVITGGSSGLGEATARHLAGLGAKLVLGARRQDRLDTIVTDIVAAGGQAIAVKTDVTRRDDLEALVAAGVEKFGRIDVLINNAGTMPLAPLNKLKVDEWESIIDINIKGVLYGIAAALPRFEAQGSGHFINLSSVAGHKVLSPMGTVYSASKFAVLALSEGLRAEVGSHIRTTVISPGAVDTDLKFHTTDPETAKGIQAFYEASQIPADAVARAIAYAIEQPDEVDINEILLRPTAQEL
ncbi:3-hydroxy acid dehydrogenase [Citrobacter freundii]|uniref:Oxidoreductase n=1 Tax=Pseudomonas monteilii TaxID=76759 RepID=A0AAP7FLC2_9PSED|nr:MULTISPECIES: SDR family oxidoreductase [Gammaproteobacteria]EHF4985732.1 SDR family oxidoreductase [Enterobacter hormaechei]EKY1501812.1 SDR family oxidoreductase [Enterobacter cloacae]VTM29404.1 short-chain dehydrogenase/reductase SDR [Klebsiella pneumoniae]HDT2670330.1 SDR family oxidoreductase [Klebsiella pneumoniae subsp. pneumoniae]EHF5049540.1 SDR family oxidoreductase [Enterobacter hormaechei]